MVVVAIVAVLTALAAPSFTPLIERWRVRDVSEGLTATMYLARSEAIKRGGNVIVIKNDSSGACTSIGLTDWSCGWKVFFDVDGGTQNCNAAVTPNECDIQNVEAPTRVSVSLDNSTGSIRFDRWGMASHVTGASVPTNMFFGVMPKGKVMTDISAARLCMGTGGRIARKKGTEAC